MDLDRIVSGGVPCAMVVLFAMVIGLLIYWAWCRAAERRAALAALAQELGLQFNPDDVWDIPTRYAQMDLFNKGDSRRASNVIVGTIDGRDVFLFDYQYTVSSGKSSTTYRFQVAILETPILAPRLRLRDENVLDHIAEWVGHDEIKFESAEFSRRTHVACDDRKFAYDIFHARLIEYLLACGNLPAMEFNGPLLLLSDSQGGGPLLLLINSQAP